MPRAKHIGLIILFNLALLPWTAILVMRATEITRAEARVIRFILILLHLPSVIWAGANSWFESESQMM